MEDYRKTTPLYLQQRVDRVIQLASIIEGRSLVLFIHSKRGYVKRNI